MRERERERERERGEGERGGGEGRKDYSLYYYDTFDRFYMNVGSLLLFALLLIGFSMYQLRRQTYDRI